MPVIDANSKMTGYKFATGRHTTVTANDAIATGLKHCEGITVSLESDPVDGAMLATGVPGAAGAANIKTWANTGGTDPTPAAGSVFGKVVNWIAWGW
jgi:hypothetical protein